MKTEWNEDLAKLVLQQVLNNCPAVHQKSLNKNTKNQWVVFIDELDRRSKGFLRISFETGGFSILLSEDRGSREEYTSVKYKDILTLFGYSLADTEKIRTFSWSKKCK